MCVCGERRDVMKSTTREDSVMHKEIETGIMGQTELKGSFVTCHKCARGLLGTRLWSQHADTVG